MIRNLLNADEDPPPGTKVVIEDTIANPPAENVSAERATEGEISENQETPPANFEIPADAQFFNQPDETAPLDERAESIETLMADIENLEPDELDRLEREIESLPEAKSLAEPVREEQIEVQQVEAEKTPEITSATAEKIPESDSESTIFQSDYTPPSTAETIRNSGLAWSAGVVLFGSVVFMMIFGWFADLLLGSSPWGILVGIVLGGLIGIVQLFRISSQIYRK